MSEALQLDLDGLKLEALAWGPPDGQPVLATHGWLDNAATHSGLAPRLCEALGLRIVSLDLPGHGLSDHKRGPYHFVDYVADLIHAADALGWQRFSLMGHSMGAGISTLVPATVPERVERCVLLEGLGPMADDPNQVVKRLARSLRVEARKRDKPKRLFESPEVAAARLAEVASLRPESALTLVRRGLAEGEGGWSWRADPSLRIDSRIRFSEDQVHAFLRAIRCPVLLIEASEGWPRSDELFAKRIASVSDIQVVRVEGRHHVHLDDPEPVAAALIPFLRPLVEAPP